MSEYAGLTSEQARVALTQQGLNELPSQKPKSMWALILSIVREPMILLLVATGAIYLVLGEPKDSAILLFSIFVVIGIIVYQEKKTENALQALKDLSSPRARVIRDKVEQLIDSRHIVIDDIIILAEGDRVPADAVLLRSQNIQLDESLLTGESLPVEKFGDNKVYSGTLVVQGSGYAKVTAVGSKTAIGKIGVSLESIQETDSGLKREVDRTVKIFGLIGIAFCIGLFVLYIIVYGDVIDGLLRGLTLSMSLLPEEFPVVLTVFLTLGALRISKKNVLTRNNQAIETLGATTVLCVDKTGTLTKNHLQLETIVTSAKQKKTSEQGTLDRGMIDVLTYAKLASKRNAFDPLEKEINRYYDKHVGTNEQKGWHLKHAYNLSKNHFAITRVWQSPKSQDYIVAAKGAPETILSLCNLSKNEMDTWLHKVDLLSGSGERVLAVASGKWSGKELPGSQKEFALSCKGLISFVDPVRSTVPSSVAECYQAGMRIIMITGDYPGTAEYIAGEAGIDTTGGVITGSELATMSVDELKKHIRTVNIFARVVPDQKLKIIQALKENGETVAMTGDGVNDGPALKAAHMGIAMGGRGTDVARESADLILLDDNFTSIVTAIKVGRTIYGNLQKAVSYILSIHIPIAGIALLPTLFNLPSILFPIHIAFLELIIDPASSVVFEAEPAEPNAMKRPPRKLDDHLFNKEYFSRGVIKGLVILGSAMTAFVIALQLGRSDEAARFIAFLTLVLGNLFLIRANLMNESILKKYTPIHNTYFYVIVGAVIAILLTIAFLPALLDIFHFAAISLPDYVLIVGIASASYIVMEALKLLPTHQSASNNGYR